MLNNLSRSTVASIAEYIDARMAIRRRETAILTGRLIQYDQELLWKASDMRREVFLPMLLNRKGNPGVTLKAMRETCWAWKRMVDEYVFVHKIVTVVRNANKAVIELNIARIDGQVHLPF